MEYFNLGDLKQCVARALPEQECQLIIFQVTEAMKFMHERNFVHKDLKPAVSVAPQQNVSECIDRFRISSSPRGPRSGG